MRRKYPPGLVRAPIDGPVLEDCPAAAAGALSGERHLPEIAPMNRTRAGLWTFLVVAVVAAAVFVRLGVWQLDRLTERRGRDQRLEARMRLPVLDLSAAADGLDLSADSLAWRRVRVSGPWDTDHTILVRGRGFRGAPGVHVVAPVLIEPDRAVLVLRGWLPAADGVSADVERVWPDVAADPPEARLVGLALPSERPTAIPARTRPAGDRDYVVLGSLVIEQAAGAVPYELLPVYVLAARDSAAGPGAPVAVPAPEMSAGTHLSYAIQWFSFATIALVGAAVYYSTRRRATETARSSP